MRHARASERSGEYAGDGGARGRPDKLMDASRYMDAFRGDRPVVEALVHVM